MSVQMAGHMEPIERGYMFIITRRTTEHSMMDGKKLHWAPQTNCIKEQHNEGN